MERKIGVLFVCTGNICRSPTAEGVLRHQAKLAGLQDRLLIDSAGTHGYHIGDPPDKRSIAAARRRGIDLSSLRARRFIRQDFEKFDYVLALDRGHFDLLRADCPKSHVARLSLFLSHLGENLHDVPDPYYGGSKDFEHALDLIERGCAALLAYIRREHFPDHG
ncbi:MAG: phosphotyrosine protein phosphatase [Alphaproteobacteria bacterium]|nr:phosphotyrosine protein phosphatase [Alphaproteobacteria bacterium]